MSDNSGDMPDMFYMSNGTVIYLICFMCLMVPVICLICFIYSSHCLPKS